MQTFRQEQARRLEESQRLRREEDRQLEQARQNSMQTFRQEQARRLEESQKLRREEARQLEQARQNSIQTFKQEQARRLDTPQGAAQSAANSQAWEPNSEHVRRAGEMLMALQRELGRTPSSSEMMGKLSSSMGITQAQARKILETMDML
ncbi:MAG: hypothetical protein ACRCYP_02190, partial [Alphaproteobacteria bacterium]